MAKQEVAMLIAEVHAVAAAIFKVLTISTFTLSHPFAVAVGVIFVFPHLHEVVAVVDVSLAIVGADAGTGGNGAVGHDGANGDAGLTRKEAVAHVALVVAEEAFATVVGTYAPLQPRGLDELEHAAELVVGEPHHRVLGRTSHREDAEQPPPAHALADEKLLDVGQVTVVAAVDAGDNVEHQPWRCHEHVDGLRHHGEAPFVAAHPVVVGFQAVQADGDAAQAGFEQSVETLARKEKAVAHHPPGESPFADFAAALFQVRAHEWLAAGDDHEHLARVGLGRNAVEHTQEVGKRHVLLLHLHFAVGAAMPATEVAPERALPEELAQRMLAALIGLVQAPEVKRQFTFESKGSDFCGWHG